jgi:hypothetical protein
MSDSGIKKVVIPKDKLGTIINTNEYVVRYRVVSEDKNRSSFWSPNYVVLSNPILNDVAGDVEVKSDSNAIKVVWDNSLDITAFDIFVSFNNASDESLKWHGATTSNNYSFIKTGAFPVRVVIQVKSIGALTDGAFVKNYNPDLVLYDSGPKSPITTTTTTTTPLV